MINDIINQITNCPYRQLENSIKVASKAERESIVAIFDEIINDYLEKIEPVEKPFIINVSGIPGSGKTTYCYELKEGKERFNNVDFSNVLYLAFDEIMMNPKLPYQTDAAEKGLEYAFSQWEVPARIAGYELLKRAIDKRINILFDHSSSMKEHVVLFQTLISQYNYDIHFIYINIDKKLAKDRVKKRANQEKRIFPLERIDERFAALSQFVPLYQEICTTFKQIEQ